MAVDLEHTFSTARTIDESYANILDLEKVVPCVQGATVRERTGPDSVNADIDVRMGAMSMVFAGTLDVTEKDPDAHRVVMNVRSREAGGQGYANATITFTLNDGGGNIHTHAQITGKAASMGEGVVAGVLEALVADFAGNLGSL